MSTHEQPGHDLGIRSGVGDFRERVPADPALSPWSVDVDRNRLGGHRTKLLVQLTGGSRDDVVARSAVAN